MTTEHLYLSQILTVLPSLSLDWVETARGQFNDVLIINKAWVFRFPRYRDSVTRLAAEAKLLKALQGHLRLPVPDPVHQNFEPPVPGLAFLGYPYLPGEQFTSQWLTEVRDEFIRDDLARQLAGFLRMLHAFPLSSLPVPQPGSLADGSLPEQRSRWESMYTKVCQKLIPLMRPDARKHVTAHFEIFLDDPALHEFTPSLRHGDFGGENIMWAPGKGKVTAVIDFSSCAVGDPAYDLASIWTLGEDFFQRLMPRYEPDSAHREILLSRARFYRGTFALEEALDGLRHNDPQAYQHGMEAFI